jgi:hypothetical protein
VAQDCNCPFVNCPLKIVEGSAVLESKLGNDSTLWFILPVELPGKDDMAKLVDEDGKADLGGLNVLVLAEDNQVNQKLVANMLKRMKQLNESKKILKSMML